jgi:hypothetical protein
VVWLNLVCLDAPLVSLAWLWLFAGTFHAPVAPTASAALFLTAWVIYLADRLADSRALPDDGPRSLRHEFCLRHQQSWLTALGLIAVVDLVILWNGIGAEIAVAGGVVGALTLIHLLLNYSLGGAWPPLPLKEFAVGFLFASGTLVAIFPVLRPITAVIALSAFAFACLCTLNCLCIAFWERKLDEAQGKVSFATWFPGLNFHLGKLSLAFGLCSGVAAIIFREVAPIFSCIAVSSFLLASLDHSRERIGQDQRTALADLVLLTPVVVLLASKM